MNGYIWLWLKTLEGSGDNRGGLRLFITIQTPGWEKQTRGRTKAQGEGAPDRFCKTKKGRKKNEIMNCSHSAGPERSGGPSELTAGPAGHLVNFNNHPDPRYPPPHTPTFPPSLLALLMGATSPPYPGWLQAQSAVPPKAPPFPAACVFCLLHPSIHLSSPSLPFSASTISSFLLTKKRCLCSRTLLMHHNSTNSTGLHCLKSEFLDIIVRIWTCFFGGMKGV